MAFLSNVSRWHFLLLAGQSIAILLQNSHLSTRESIYILFVYIKTIDIVVIVLIIVIWVIEKNVVIVFFNYYHFHAGSRSIIITFITIADNMIAFTIVII